MAMNPSGAMSAIIYCRVSTTEQVQEGVSLQAQQARAEAWCQAQGLQVAGVFVDEGLSGGTMNREGLRAALAEACRLKSPLVTYSLSRVTRSVKDALAVVEQLERAGSSLVSLTEQLDTRTASGRFTFTVLSSVGQLERELVGERTRAALAFKRTKGERISGRAPLGCRFEDGTVVPDLEELDSIATLRSWRRSGLSFRAIQRRANRLLPARGAKGWGLETIHRICRDSMVSPAKVNPILI